MTEKRAAEIRARLERELAPLRMQILDESHLHAGHAGARAGGHFRVEIVSEAFRGRALRERHSIVHCVLADMFRGDIHALSIRALAPDEDSTAATER